MCLIFTVYFNRRERRPPSKKSRKRDSSDKLRKLDAVSPSRTLEECLVFSPLLWMVSHYRLFGSPSLTTLHCSVVCLEPVLRSQVIRELKCLHVFHRECLDKWYLQDHYNCPLCHRAYFYQETRPTNDFVWMIG
ncbi:hypothetical protein AN5051.2 [Aspergillus nidulans FGSC A4]|uniref:RING finger domain protein, putative (AFU_orthologue AFUA_3G12190) n=1 Tax=Emericella nidulans (strain FGSC A4 / ATCC 38163 / CBS 112.46 / NRRL 194 / M139) TaxID=227321 RepID=Q5B329_EMENI|nr:hypothetical protein [Aspergillus nidulans FGSC A4]EAA61129.1 hypothetical protein AN5051.2 [Aspergillus nidulans FGSC A4]CBF76197.1 TPA: RING finger domain protein, putative (AFU_orthologue; AFUA_3G12190) [Aspergillus nidulans FGSC A4]|eukprot:XP_662655.1 hypothetical protein AN5051.2 [Aspergillus nidulans FGSC A4]